MLPTREESKKSSGELAHLRGGKGWPAPGHYADGSWYVQEEGEVATADCPPTHCHRSGRTEWRRGGRTAPAS